MATTLRQRMLQDLQLAGLSERTQEAYLRAVRQLADHFHTPPDRLSEPQVRDYFLHLKNDRKFASASLGIAYSGIKFFYSHTRPARLADAPEAPRAQGEEAARRALGRGGATAHRRRPHAPQPGLFLDGLLAGTSAERGAASAGRRHRQPTNAGARASRQGGQGPLRAAARPHADGAAAVLDDPSPPAVAVPGPGSGRATGGRRPTGR